MSVATKSQPLTRSELDELVAAGVLHVPLRVAARAFGLGEAACRTAATEGNLPVRTFTVGRTTRVVLADLVDLFTGRGDSEAASTQDAAIAHPGPDRSEHDSDGHDHGKDRTLRAI